MRSAALFLLAIFTPCALLGWVSWRSMREEANEIRRSRTTHYQQSADNTARDASAFMAGQVREFGETVDRLLASDSAERLRLRFHTALRGAWPMADAGMVLDGSNGRLMAQTEPSEQAVTAFVARHAWFFQADAQPLYIEIPADNLPVPAPVPKLAAGMKMKTAEKDAVTLALESLVVPDAAVPPPAPKATPAPAEIRSVPADPEIPRPAAPLTRSVASADAPIAGGLHKIALQPSGDGAAANLTG